MTRLQILRTTRISRLVAVSCLLATTASLAWAQSPSSRPGLILFDDTGQPVTAGTPSANPAASPQSTTLAQRNYTGEGGPAGTGTAQTGSTPSGAGQTAQGASAGNSDEFFFTEEGAPGPSEVASGLSNMNSNTMVQTGQQLNGNYGTLQRGGMPTGQIQEAWARPFDNMSQGQTAPGNVRFQWSHDLIMPVRLRDGMVTNLIIPDWDEALDVIVGDSATLEGRVIRGNVVALRPLAVGRDTSLTVIGGSGNVYSFYVRTEGRNTQVVTDVQVFVQAAPSKGSVDWFTDSMITSGGSGSGEMRQISPRVSEDSIVRSGSASQGEELVSVDRRIFDMKMYEVNEGDRIIAPDYVYSDGKFTYFHFPAGMTDRPVIRRIVDTVEGRVNTRVGGRHNEIVIAEAVGDFVLRSGTRVVCVIQVDERGAVVRR
jgi:type IV secretory pathway VirB9-like protein